MPQTSVFACGKAEMSEKEVPLTKEASDELALLKVLTEQFKGEANNGSLRDALTWDADHYWLVRNRLLANGRVQKAHGGPGGKTILSPSTPNLIGVPTVSVAEEAAGGVGRDTVGEQPRREYEDEASLYEPMLKEIDANWILDEGYDSKITRLTALAGRRDTGGKWTRPDISVIAIQKFKFLREPVFDVISFEVKPRWEITVEGIFEALAHRQYTTRAYLVFHVSNEAFESEREANRIIALAEQHGIGVILAEKPDNYDSWIERVRARRWAPDPTDLNDFIQRVFPATDHDEIIKLAK
jgi:hypothetical protein